MTATLLILAATMGNRYGGLKYPEAIGPNGETVLDYSIYDAVKAGFKRVIFVISRCFEDDFKNKISAKYQGLVEVDYVYQEVDLVPEKKRNPKRAHLWGSAQAVLTASDKIKEPFGVINAVNFYQRESFELLYRHLQEMDATADRHVLINYKLANVIPEGGGANRGICEIDSQRLLKSVTDRPGVERISGDPMYLNEYNKWIALDENAPVSMNMWGFSPAIFQNIRKDFDHFIDENGMDLKSFFTIPDFINGMIAKGEGSVKAYETQAVWMGVVSPDDKIQTILKINEMIRCGIYPKRLFAESE
ncbi:MAG: hypothetical protein IJ467_08315 [Bacteroidaceae bacterium]|nr:hypothetical protein [Bacteroidaceae bacterium]